MVKRLARLFQRRLPLVVIVVIIGTIGAAGLTRYFNEQIRPTFQATAVYSISAEGESASAARNTTAGSSDLAAAQEAALDANAEVIDPNHGVRGIPASESIEFTVIAETPDAAIREAGEMRGRFLVAIAPAPIEQRMQDVLDEAHFVRETLDVLLPSEVVVTSDPAVVSQREALNEQIRSLNGESARLAVELVLADTESARAALQEDLDLILSQIVQLRQQLDALPVELGDSTTRDGGTPQDTASRTGGVSLADNNSDLNDQFQIESLQQLYSSLLLEFQSLYIQSIDGEPQILPEIDVTDETSTPIAIPVGAGAGFAGTLLLALGAVLVGDRLKPKWWVAGDLEPGIAEVPDRRSPGLEPWYWTTGPSKRKEAVQRVAVALLPALESGVNAIGLVGSSVKPRSLRGLAVDLAATMVTAGRSSLVIDATGLETTGKSDPEDSPWEGPSVGDLLNPWQNDSTEDHIDHAMTNAKRLWPGLSVLPSGSSSLYSVEGAMTPVIGNLVDAARRSFALTLVPIADHGTALTDALVRRLDAVVLVGRGSATSLREAEKLAERLRLGGNTVLGSVLVVKATRRKLRELFRRNRQPTRVAESAVVDRSNEAAKILVPQRPTTASMKEGLNGAARSNGASGYPAAAIDLSDETEVDKTPTGTSGQRPSRGRGTSVKGKRDPDVSAEEPSASAS